MIFQYGICTETLDSNAFGKLSIGNLIRKIEMGEGFGAIKLCHGVWEACARTLQRTGNSQLTDDQWRQELQPFSKTYCVDDLFEIFQRMATASNFPNLVYLVSEEGWENGLSIEGTPLVGVEETTAVINSFFEPGTRLYEGLFWKNAVCDLSIIPFLDAIKNKKVLIVGPSWVERFADFAGLEDSEFIEVHASRASWDMSKALARIENSVSALGGQKVICLLQAGDATSAWLIGRLHEKFPGSFFIDLGQVLSLCNISRLDGVNWFMVERERICRCIDAINYDWNHTRNDLPVQSAYHQLDDQHRWPCFSSGYDAAIKSINPDVNFSADQVRSKHLAIEKVDYFLLHQLLSGFESLEVSSPQRELEKLIQGILDLPSSRKVVLTPSYSVAVKTIVDFFEKSVGHTLKWVLPKLTSDDVAMLPSVRTVSCDDFGLLDIGVLEQMSESEWDGVIVTNFCGLSNDIEPFEKLCRLHKKILILDNQKSYVPLLQSNDAAFAEIISFDENAPWGVQQGGALLMAEREELLFRKYIEETANTVGNIDGDSLSSYQCGLTMQRQLTFPNWGSRYKLQHRRIAKLAKKAGLKPLRSGSEHLIVDYAPFSLPVYSCKEMEENNGMFFKRVDFPTSSDENPDLPTQKILLISCNPKMSELSDDFIKFKLQGFANL